MKIIITFFLIAHGLILTTIGAAVIPLLASLIDPGVLIETRIIIALLWENWPRGELIGF